MRSGHDTCSSGPTPGLFAERWVHAGCRRWFNAVRDTATYRFHRVYRVDEQKPAIHERTIPHPPTGGRIDRSTTLQFTFDGRN